MNPTQPEGNNPTPPPAANPSDSLVAAASNLFGQAEVVKLNDDRFPTAFRRSIEKLKITTENPIVAVTANVETSLCAIGIAATNQNLYEKLLAINPWLDDTTWSRWYEIIFFWVRVTGWRPINRELPGMVWFSQGLLPVVDAVSQEQRVDTFPIPIRNKPPIVLKFDEIKWFPEIHEAFVLEHAEGLHGKLVQQVGPRKKIVNYQTAAVVMATVLGIIFDKNRNCFQYCPPGESEWKILPQIQLDVCIAKWLQCQAASDPAAFPKGDHVKAVVRAIKEIYPIERPAEPEGLNEFLRRCVERRAGANLTTQEFYISYFESCKSTGALAYPECVFLDVLPKFIRETFGLTKVHNVMRHNPEKNKLTARCGFNGLGLRPEAEAKEVTETKDVTDGGTGKTL